MAESIKNVAWPEWETVRLIGRGSFGAVYEIQKDIFGDVEKAALKVISIPQNESDIDEMYSDGYDEESITATFQSHLKSIIAEYSLMRKMSGCANIVNCDDVRYVQRDDGVGWDIFIKMELLTPLTKALPANASEKSVIQLGIDMCCALEMCSRYDVVHRDIKPQNIFVSDDGVYKLGDFGIAKTVEKTMGGTKIGTYKYMAPEVYNNRPYGSGADIYSLGLVMYWLLNERRMPFLPLPPAKLTAGMEEQARQRRFDGEQFPAPAHGSDRLKQIVQKACAYNPKERYTSATEMLNDLKRLRDGVPIAAWGAGASAVQNAAVTAQSAQSENPDICIRFLNTDGTVIQAHNYRPGEPVTAPEMVQEFEHEGVRYRLVGWNPDVPSAAAAPVDCQVIYEACEKAPVVGPAVGTVLESESGGSGKKGIVAACLALCLIGGALAVWRPWDSAPSTGQADSSVSSESQAAVSTPGNAEGEPKQLDWSDWTTALPASVTSAKYEIEEQTLYRSRELETTSSTSQSSMSGWELYNTVDSSGDWGLWSDWSANAMSTSSNRQVETQTRYRYRDKETTTSPSSSMGGWTLYDTTYSWGDWDDWNDWSEDSVSSREDREVEKKTQYRYRAVTVSQEYSDWSDWSSWSANSVSASDTCQVESKLFYRYYYFLCHGCGDHNPFSSACGCGSTSNSWNQKWFPISYASSSSSAISYTSIKRQTTSLGDDQLWYFSAGNLNDTAVGTRDSNGADVIIEERYRYRTRTPEDVMSYGSWSSWGDKKYSETDEREVETRKMYRYREREKIPVYHYSRWSDWSGWSTTAVSATNNRQVENTTYYRYRDKVTQKTYYFQRWTDWSDYSTSQVTDSDSIQVETMVQYRFKSKD